MNNRRDVQLKILYEKGTIGPEEFIRKLFESEEADRVRREIVGKTKKRV